MTFLKHTEEQALLREISMASEREVLSHESFRIVCEDQQACGLSQMWDVISGFSEGV